MGFTNSKVVLNTAYFILTRYPFLIAHKTNSYLLIAARSDVLYPSVVILRILSGNNQFNES